MQNRKLGQASLRGESFFDEIESCIKSVLDEAGLKNDVSEQLAFEVSNRMSEQFGGRYIYVLQNRSIKISQRDREIYADFDGRNQNELSIKYNLSVVWIYKVIRKVQKAEIARRQFNLFD